MNTKRTLKKIKTKNMIYLSALDLFKQKGYNSISVDDIVARAGISKGTFYNHFKSKNELIINRFKEIDTHYIKIYRKVNNEESTKAKVMLFTKLQLTYIQNRIGLDTLQVAFASLLNASGDNYINSSRRPLFVVLSKILEEGQKKHEIRNDIPVSEITEALIHCMRGLFYNWCTQNGSFNLVQAGQKYFELILEGFENRDKKS